MIDLMLGDCIEKMMEIEDDSVDLIVTSPPYNNWRNRRVQKKREDFWNKTNIVYNSYGDDMPDGEYEQWQIDFLNECFRVLKPTGTVIYNHKDRIFNFEVTSPLKWILQSKLVYRQRVTWDRCSMQAYNPVRFYRVEEDIYILGKNAKGFKWNKGAAKYLSIWRIKPSAREEHPASFPIEIPSRCIEAFTYEGDVVLDPFMGSGTTGLACVSAGRNFIGIEKDETYFDLSKSRIEQQQKEN